MLKSTGHTSGTQTALLHLSTNQNDGSFTDAASILFENQGTAMHRIRIGKEAGNNSYINFHSYTGGSERNDASFIGSDGFRFNRPIHPKTVYNLTVAESEAIEAWPMVVLDATASRGNLTLTAPSGVHSYSAVSGRQMIIQNLSSTYTFSFVQTADSVNQAFTCGTHSFSYLIYQNHSDHPKGWVRVFEHSYDT